MALDKSLNDIKMQNFCQRIQIQDQIVRNRLQSGDSLTAQEIWDGVRLSHDDFVTLVQLAMPAINEAMRKVVSR